MNTLRLITRRLSGPRWDSVGALVDVWQATEIPQGKAIQDHLQRFIREEGLFSMASDILATYDGHRSGLDPRAYLQRLGDMLSPLDEEATDGGSYIGGSRTYHKELLRGRVSVGLKRIDQAIRGGLGPGEYGLVIAPPKGGKTTILINFGCAAALQGRRVLHISLEIHKDMVLERLDMRIGGYTSDALSKDPRKIVKCRNKIRKTGGDIIIADLSHERVTADRVEGLIEKHMPLGLVIVDYPGLMVGDSQDRRIELGGVTRDLRRLSSQFSIPIWGASQGNRASFQAEDFGLGQVAEDFSQGGTADVVLCWVQSPESKARRIGRMKVDATRGSSSNPSVMVRMDYDTMTMSEVAERMEAPNVAQGKQGSNDEARKERTGRKETSRAQPRRVR